MRPMSGVDAVESEVRELVRRRGIDPVTDRLAVRRLVDEVVADYDERALTSAPSPLGDVRPAACTTRSPASGRYSGTSTTRTSRRSGSTVDYLGGSVNEIRDGLRRRGSTRPS